MRPVGERGDTFSNCRKVLGNSQVKVEFGCATIAKLDHLAELPGGIDVHHRERNRGWSECLLRQV
jgi:hypothetical protein